MKIPADWIEAAHRQWDAGDVVFGGPVGGGMTEAVFKQFSVLDIKFKDKRAELWWRYREGK